MKSENNGSGLLNGFTIIYFSLFLVVGFAYVARIVNSGIQQIPMWVLLATGLMLFISGILCLKSGNYTGIITGVIVFVGVLFMMWIIPNFSINHGNAALDEMMRRILSSLNYMPALAGILSVGISFAYVSSE